MHTIDKKYQEGSIDVRQCKQLKNTTIRNFEKKKNFSVTDTLKVCIKGEMCDGGCFHGIMEQAVEDTTLSDSRLTELVGSCLTVQDQWQKYECIHGIGHGLSLKVGDNKLNLLEGLGYCDRIVSDAGLRHGCYTGVFMGGLEHQILNPQYFKSDNPFFPCESVPENYRNACYSELPFRTYLTGGSVWDASKNCLKITNPNWAETCRQMLYRNITRESISTKEKQQLCLNLESFSAECIEWISSNMRQLKGLKSGTVEEFCSGLTGDNLAACDGTGT